MEIKKNIILIDDHVLVRNGLKELIEKLGSYKVVGEFDTGLTFLNDLSSLQDTDLVIMDLNMPGMSGIEVMETLNSQEYHVPVLILTLDSNTASIVRLFRNGVRGFLKKDCSSETMRTALESIFQSGYFNNEFLALSLRNDNYQEKTPQAKILDQLTVREREFLRLVCHEKEYTYEQIAGEMNVQHRTVDGYREAIFEKFGIKSKTGLVLFILKHELFGQL